MRLLAVGDICGQAGCDYLLKILPSLRKEKGIDAVIVNGENAAVVGHIFTVIPKIAEAEGSVNGYRVVSNCGADAGQTVPHLHFHILGGKMLSTEMA